MSTEHTPSPPDSDFGCPPGRGRTPSLATRPRIKPSYTSRPPALLQLVRIAGLLTVTAFAGNAAAQSMFHQKIPIKIPQGVHGMQPNLALEYDPNAGNGIVGVGWQLTGLSTITRVNYGKA